MKFPIYFLFFLVILAYMLGMALIDVMNIDSAHYAEMARELLSSGDFLVFRNRAVDYYLDKPPMIFWLSALSFKLFGVSPFTFRIPALLATLLGGYSTYRFSRLFYKEETARLAALILLTCQFYFLMNHNFLTDTLLVNFVIFSCWQIQAYIESKKWFYFLGAFAGLSFAMMSKGPLGLMVPVIAFSSHWIYKSRFREFIRWEWLAGAVLIFLFLIPMMMGLYRQYGKLGLEFFWWTQSFGRITGQSHWHDTSSGLFFVHTFLWAFLPWSIAAITGLVRSLVRLVRSRFRSEALPEVITAGGFFIGFLGLSISKYKLPQYILVLFPFAAILAANLIHELTSVISRSQSLKKFLTGAHLALTGLYWTAILALVIISFPTKDPVFWIIAALLLSINVLFFFRKEFRSARIYLPLAMAAVSANIILNIQVYPELMKYQPEKQIANFIRQKNIPESSLYEMNAHSGAFDFHLGYTPPEVNLRKIGRLLDRRGYIWLITDQQGYDQLLKDRVHIERETRFEFYPIQIMTLDFLNPRTRQDELKHRYLLRLTC